jgi:hypothetical protein
MYYQVNLPAGEKHHDPDIGDLVGGDVIQVDDAVAATKSYLEKTRRRGPRLPEVASPAPKVAPEVASEEAKPSEASPPTSKPSKSRKRRRKKDA